METATILAIILWASTAAFLMSQLNSRIFPWQKLAVLFGVSSYFTWRIVYTIIPWLGDGDVLGFYMWFILAIEMISIADFLQYAVLSAPPRSQENHNAYLLANDPADIGDPQIDVVVPTLNEPVEMLRRSLIQALAIDYKNKSVYLLDDGKRDEARDLCVQLGVSYLRRQGTEGGKAGNMNAALPKLEGEFILILDAEFIAFREILKVALGNFDDPKVGVLQLPQSYQNYNSFQRNSGPYSAIDDEQRLWYNKVLPMRDDVGMATLNGSCSIVRRSALDAIGGFFPESTNNSGFDTSIRLLEKGYVTRSVNQQLATGLSNEKVDDFYSRRAHLARGNAHAWLLAWTRREGLSKRELFMLIELRNISRLARTILMLVPALYFLFGLFPLKADSLFVYLSFVIPMLVLASSLDFQDWKGSIYKFLTLQSRTGSISVVMTWVMLNQVFGLGRTVSLVIPTGNRYLKYVNMGIAVLAPILLVQSLGMTFGIRDVFFENDDRVVVLVILVWAVWNACVILLGLIRHFDRTDRRAKDRFVPREPSVHVYARNSLGEVQLMRAVDVSETGLMTFHNQKLTHEHKKFMMDDAILGAQALRSLPVSNGEFLTSWKFDENAGISDDLIRYIYSGRFAPIESRGHSVNAESEILPSSELDLANEEKAKQAIELDVVHKEKGKLEDELAVADEETDKRADELAIANEENDKKAKDLVIANEELAFQNKEKDKRAEELTLANEEKDRRADELTLANEDLAFQNSEKDKRDDELDIANREKEKRADELTIANEEKDKKAKNLVIVNEELAFQNKEKDRRADELVVANNEKDERAKELILANKELGFQNAEKDKRANELVVANVEKNRRAVEQERIAVEWTQFIDAANAPIFGIDSNGKVNVWNQNAESITGYDKREVMGRNLVSNFITRKYRESVGKVLSDALNGKETANFEFPLFSKSGEQIDVLLNSTTRRNASGEAVGVIGVGQDVTEQKRANGLIWKQAHYDILTGLPNRRMARDRLEETIKKSRRTGFPFALLMLDIDRFKEVNDALGHAQGDLLLVEIGRRITKCVRESDTVSRLGGDEFAIILSDLGHIEKSGHVAQKIIEALAMPFRLGDNTSFVSACMGITLSPNDAVDSDTLRVNADEAMYLAKTSGGNRVCHYTKALRKSNETRRRMLSDLRGALLKKQIKVQYQPIVEIATGKIFKAEALMRWQHPEFGMVEPKRFIPLAEESGLIHELGDWIFQEATREVARWRELFDPKFQVSVNVLPVQFRQNGKGHEPLWISHLRREDLSGRSLIVEITEGILVKPEMSVKNNLRLLRKAGIQVALDDFGTGYSSLAYLKTFDIDYLKIDQSFVRNMGADTDDQALCEGIIVMAHKLGLKVIAEGVETEKQLSILESFGCDYAQGWLYSKAVTAENLEIILQKQADAALPVIGRAITPTG